MDELSATLADSGAATISGAIDNLYELGDACEQSAAHL
jgi:hypothetical protein